MPSDIEKGAERCCLYYYHYTRHETTAAKNFTDRLSLNNNIDIGTQILYFQCFVTTDMFLFCKPTIFKENCRICRDLAFGSVKTHFKAILKKLDFSAQTDFSAKIDFFMNFCPRRATKLRSLRDNLKISSKMPKVSKVKK